MFTVWYCHSDTSKLVLITTKNYINNMIKIYNFCVNINRQTFQTVG